MWDIVSEVYTRTTDFIPTLIFCGSQEELNREVKSNFGEVHLFPRYPEVIKNPNLDWSVTWTLYWAIANKFPDDVCLFSGIDEIPISTVLWDRLEKIPNDKYVVPLGANPYRKFGLHGIIASGHNCALGSTFKRTFQIEEHLDDELKKVWNLRYEYSKRVPRNLFALENLQQWWGLDEAYISSKVYDHPDVIFFEDEWAQEYLQARKIDRSSDCVYDIDKLRERYYWTAHLVRPLSDPNNKRIVMQLLEDMGLR
jgi:hypothetical protein